MIQTIEAVIDEQGTVRLLHPIHMPAPRRALVTILEEQPTFDLDAVTYIEDWDTPRDDMQLLLRETAAWDAASDEDALKLERSLLEMN